MTDAVPEHVRTRARELQENYMTCVRLNTGWKYCLVGVLGGMGLAILKRPLAPVLLAVGGIGGTALDQRQQYTACHTLKKELDEFRSVVAAYMPSPPRSTS